MTLMGGGIVLIAGVPAAGKTSLARHLEYTAPPHIFVRRWTLDDHPNEGSLKDKNDRILKEISTVLCSSPDMIVLVDDNFHLRSMRKRYIQLAEQFGAGIIAIHVACSLEAALLRNRNRIGALPDDVVRAVYNRFEPIDEPRLRPFLIDYLNCTDIWSDILSTLHRRPYPMNIATITNNDDQRWHELHLCLNQIAGEEIFREVDPLKKQLTSRLLSRAKKQLWAALRQREYHEIDHSLLKDMLLSEYAIILLNAL